jgi:putative endonuclease
MLGWHRGQPGEQMAVGYLQQQGYRIQQQNYRCRHGEIDIIAWDGPTLVFVEVKSKRQTAFGSPQAMVGQRKQHKIIRVAMVYVQQHRLQNVALRFDVVAITYLPGTPPAVTHVLAAFEASSTFLY